MEKHHWTDVMGQKSNSLSVKSQTRQGNVVLFCFNLPFVTDFFFVFIHSFIHSFVLYLIFISLLILFNSKVKLFIGSVNTNSSD